MAAGGGGAWKVAYADFVTAMMAFFLVMWITAQSNAVKQSIARYFEHPFDAASRSPIQTKSSSGSSLVPTHREMEGTQPKASSKGKSGRGGGIITDDAPPADPANVPKTGGLRKRSGVMLRNSDDTGLGTIIQFPADSAELDESAIHSLNEALPRFLGKLNKIEIRGHAAHSSSDEPKNGGAGSPDDWQLSYGRCLATMKYLEAHGIEAKRIRLSQAGSFEPPTEEEQRASTTSSRVEVYMLGEYADDYLRPSKRPVEDNAGNARGDDSSSAVEATEPVAGEKSKTSL